MKKISEDSHLSYMSAGLLRWRRLTDIPLIALAVGSLPLLLLELVSERLTRTDQSFLVAVNILVFVAFCIDYLMEFALASNRQRYIRTEWTSLLIVLTQGSALLPTLGFLGLTRALRALRPLVFIGRLVGIGASESNEIRSLLKSRALSLALSVAGLVWVTSAVGFTIAEDVGDGRRIQSFGDALWWSASTISTVGYGDVYPVTAVGRVIAILTMIVGVSTFGVITAKIASILMRSNS